MLTGLDDLDWGRLIHAYGPADDVPGQIRALRSADPKDRAKAYHDLYGNIFHQGTRYDATAHAVPFLLELLADAATPDRAELLTLLTHLAIGYDENLLPEGLRVDQFRQAAVGGAELVAAGPRPGDPGWDEEYADYEYVESLSPEDQGRHGTYLALAAYDAVRAGVPLFRGLLADPDPAVRTAAGFVLAWFPEDAAGSLPALTVLIEAATRSADTAVAVDSDGDGAIPVATALVAVGLLGGTPDAALLADPRPLVRWGTAIGRARALRGDTDQATVDELLHWAGGAGQGSGPGAVPFHSGDLAGYAGLALGQTGPRYADEAFETLLTRLGSVSGVAALPVVEEAMRQAFPSGPLPTGTPYSALTRAQRRLVDALAEHPAAWLIDGAMFANFMGMVRSYGLPSSNAAIRTYRDADQSADESAGG